MKIESDLLNISMQQSDRVQEPAKPDTRSSTRAQEFRAASDGVEVGSQASLVAAAQTAGVSDRTDTVQRLRALIQSGQYRMDNAALSESIVTAALHGY